MTVYISLANSTDGAVYCTDASYANTISGAGTKYATNTSIVTWGQSYGALTPTTYTADEGFFEFPYTLDATSLLVTAHIGFISAGAHSATISRSLDVREYDWGGTLDTGDFRTPAQLNALTLLGRTADAQSAAADNTIRVGSANLLTRLNTTGTVRVVIASTRLESSSTPTTDERADVYSGDVSFGPYLTWTTVPLSTLNRVGGAQVMLSDGTTVVLEAQAAEATLTAGNLLLRRVSTAGVATTIATLSVGTTPGFAANRGGAQSFALARDASDNLYVIGRQSGANTTVCAQAFIKGAGLTWTAATALNGSLSSYDQPMDAYAVAWHSVGGTAGTLVMLVGAPAGSGYTNQFQGAMLSCDALLAGSGTLFRGTFDFPTLFTSYGSGYQWFYNELATGFDIDAAPGTTNRGCAISYNGDDGYGPTDPAVSRYILASDGASFSNVAKAEWNRSVVRDANSRLRIIGVDGTRFLTSGGTVPFDVLQSIGTGAQSEIGMVTRSEMTASTLPATLYDHQLWDVVYDPTGGKAWLYYTSSGDSKRLCRTGFSLSTMLADNTEVVVSATVGGASATNYAIRAPRGALAGTSAIVSVASKSASGTYSTVYVADSFNVPPNAPTLGAKTNFDATASSTFAWTFSDPNPSDTQSAFQLQIASSAGTAVYDTGQLSGVITYVAAGSAALANNASVTPGLPAGWASGDLLVMLAGTRTGTVNTPSGWTSLSASGGMAVLGRIARSADTAPTVTFTGGSANSDTMARIAAFRGTDQNIATVVHASAVQGNASAQNISTPALTITADGCAVIRAAYKRDDWTNISTPSGYTMIGASATDMVSTAGDDAGEFWCYKIETTASSLSSGSHTVTGGASATSVAVALALRPYQAPTSASFTLPASTISNGLAYQWRTRTWDAAGASGAYSGYQAFSTAAGGNVTVTYPAADNPPGIITSFLTVTWSVSGTTQQDYRVVTTRTDTLAVVNDSGWVTSSATSYATSGMVTDIEHQIAVTVRNGALVESGTGTRLVTPSYSTPDAPVLTVTPVSDYGYVLISVNNPVPTGSRPTVSENYLHRREYGSSGAYTRIDIMENNGQYRDYAVASGTTYEYVAEGVV